MTLDREELRDGWTVSLVEDGASGVAADLPTGVRGVTLPATVPGQVHTDLERAGLLPDPTFDRNETRTQWVGQSDWAYRRQLDVDPRGHERVDLVCDGLDTVAELSLDGVPIATTRNMHRRYRFDLRQVETSGPVDGKELEIAFESPYREAERVAARAGSMPGPYDEPFPYVRKMASNFGWDWGLTAVTSGPWRPVAIERWSTARLADIRPLVDVEAGEGVLDTHIALERSGPTLHGTSTGDLDLDGEDDDLVLVVTVSGPTVDGRTTKQRSRAQVTPKEDGAVVTVRVPDAALWWPRGYGEQALHDVVVELQTVDGAVLDRRSFRTGFRSAGVRTALDSAGRPFEVVVNGTVIDVRGVNWIPDDVIVSRVDRARYAARLDAAVDLRANLVRVWGGGVYESHDFYELCDERGLLVWQDFPFACAAYPEDEPLRGEVIAEAQDNVARLSRHPSLVVWNGNNENIWLHDVDGWGDELGDRPWGLGYYLDLLPTIVDAVDPSRFYTVASPWSGSESIEPNHVDHETHHSWDVWNRVSDDHYRDSVPRFVSEFGWQAPPAWRTLRDAVTDEPMTPTSPGVVHHQKAADGMAKLARGIEPRFGSAGDDLDRWHYLTQLQQARAIATGVEHWRTHWPRNTGVVVWQLNDLWPVSSWSAIDSAGRRKPLAHELRRLYDDVLVAIRPVSTVDTAVRAVPTEVDDRTGGPAPRTASLPVTDVAGSGTVPGDDGRDDPSRASDASPVEVAVRSARTGLDTVVRVRRIDLSGRILAEETLPVVLDRPGVAVVRLPASVGVVDDARGEVVVADMDWRRAVWTPAPDREMRWQPARYRATFSATPEGDGLDLVVEADSLVRDLLVQPDRVAATGTVDRGFMTLLPGERVRYRLTGVGEADIAALTSEPALLTLDRVLAERRSEAEA
ncbi:glycoside hydrolase family 2 protein [Curtobacterium sp. MCJR17_055]|uniref:glycoside hydrolase family 2 protein n=1 Tax=unclassified Curtobacterium TaxID=257496 RepID=UPI000D86AED8|nr:MULTISPECIES: glycoside hydrolase family 2 protein [unclassified Curtobacterium]PYY33835.1 glycoside hydrolase family 2 protein [Curtobacterium sp. MCBD17_029]PYY58694.1 glycoside hydrolase family 2 protein [Curtobacterium sp. MCJR17_055]PYY59764.1 glycoside hydrolase family 2 protein [Curtobacterium sp. MCPF17_015]